MTVTTITQIPPQIHQRFSRYMLVPWEGIMEDFRKNREKWDKKIPSGHTGRRREFDALCVELQELYERAKITQG